MIRWYQKKPQSPGSESGSIQSLLESEQAMTMDGCVRNNFLTF